MSYLLDKIQTMVFARVAQCLPRVRLLAATISHNQPLQLGIQTVVSMYEKEVEVLLRCGLPNLD